MLKPAIISLLTAALVLAVGTCLLLSSDTVPQAARGLAWNAAEGRVIAGSAVPVPGGRELVADHWGEAALSVPVEPFPARRYPILHLRFGQLPERATLALMWNAAWATEKLPPLKIPARPGRSFWLDLDGQRSWSGMITDFTVVILAAPGERATIERIELLPATLARRLQVLLDQWFSFGPWQHISVNYHDGVLRPGVSLYPVPLLAALLGLSLLVYGCLLWLGRGGRRFDWRVPALLAVLCWAALDALWQADLWWQLRHTRDQFAGKSDPQKLAAGIDAELVAFTGLVRQRLAAPDARVFVASADDYLGMRGAYYLYPANTYWRRKDSELPEARYLRSGDYIATIAPTALRYDAPGGVLVTPEAGTVPVERLFAGATGSLYRVR